MVNIKDKLVTVGGLLKLRDAFQSVAERLTDECEAQKESIDTLRGRIDSVEENAVLKDDFPNMSEDVQKAVVNYLDSHPIGATDVIENGNMMPVTSNAVYELVGNAEALMKTI